MKRDTKPLVACSVRSREAGLEELLLARGGRPIRARVEVAGQLTVDDVAKPLHTPSRVRWSAGHSAFTIFSVNATSSALKQRYPDTTASPALDSLSAARRLGMNGMAPANARVLSRNPRLVRLVPLRALITPTYPHRCLFALKSSYNAS